MFCPQSKFPNISSTTPPLTASKLHRIVILCSLVVNLWKWYFRFGVCVIFMRSVISDQRPNPWDCIILTSVYRVLSNVLFCLSLMISFLLHFCIPVFYCRPMHYEEYSDGMDVRCPFYQTILEQEQPATSIYASGPFIREYLGLANPDETSEKRPPWGYRVFLRIFKGLRCGPQECPLHHFVIRSVWRRAYNRPFLPYELWYLINQTCPNLNGCLINPSSVKAMSCINVHDYIPQTPICVVT